MSDDNGLNCYEQPDDVDPAKRAEWQRRWDEQTAASLAAGDRKYVENTRAMQSPSWEAARQAYALK